MNSRYFFPLVFALILTLFSCGRQKVSEEQIMQIDVSKQIVNDSMIYGLACEGTNDSVVVIYPLSGEDPVTYSCIDAYKAKHIIGKPEIGDWIGIMIDKNDSTAASMIINLDLLKGTWTYPVMPTFKDFKNLSEKMRKRMEAKAIKELPDSEKALYLIPREYGFSLKRNHIAQSVGMVYSGNGMNDDSPVEYPEVKLYEQWFSWNGRLILVSAKMLSPDAMGKKHKQEIVFDTLDFVSLSGDSLILTYKNNRIGFHRKTDAISANAEATKKAQEADRKAIENLKQ